MTIKRESDGTWTWKGSKEGAQEFDELATAEALKQFDEIGELCWLQKNPEINADTEDEYYRLVYESMEKTKGERGARTCWNNDCWDHSYVKAYLRSIGKTWYTWLIEHTSGNARSRLKAIVKTDKGLSWNFRGSVMSSYGGFTEEQIDEAQQAFDSAKYKGAKVPPDGNIIEYIEWMGSQQEKLMKMYRTEDEHSASTFGGPEKLAELICKGLPAYYKTELRNLKKAKKQDAKISNPKMSNAELNAMFGHKWIPELGVLTEEMSQAYRDRCAEKGIDGDALGIDGRSNSGTNGAGTTMLGGGGGYNEEPCWDCDLPGHRRGDPVCRTPGAVNGSKAPAWLKQLKAEGKDTTPQSKYRSTKRQGGAAKKAPPCRYAQKGQKCPRKQCRFNHDRTASDSGGGDGGGGGGGGKSNGAAMTAKQRKALKKEVIEETQQAIMVGMKRAAEADGVGDGGGGGGDQSEAKKGKTLGRFYSALAAASKGGGFTWMAKDVPMGESIAISEPFAQKLQAALSELHSVGSSVGIDTDSSRSASTEKQDFLWLNTSRAACEGNELHGVGGGVAKCAGVGPMAVVTMCDPVTGIEVIVIDPEAYHIKSDVKFRIFAQTKMCAMRLPLKQDHNDTGVDVLLCKDTKHAVPVWNVGGISVIKTSRRDAKFLMQQTDAQSIVELIKQGKRSCAVTMTPGNPLRGKQLQRHNKAKEVLMAAAERAELSSDALSKANEGARAGPRSSGHAKRLGDGKVRGKWPDYSGMGLEWGEMAAIGGGASGGNTGSGDGDGGGERDSKRRRGPDFREAARAGREAGVSRSDGTEGDSPVLGRRVQQWFDAAYAGEETEGAATGVAHEESDAEWAARTDEMAKQMHGDAALATSMLDDDESCAKVASGSNACMRKCHDSILPWVLNRDARMPSIGAGCSESAMAACMGSVQRWLTEKDDGAGPATRVESWQWTASRGTVMMSGGKTHFCFVLNESKLKPEERARLWHWRLGHCDPYKLVNMSKQGLALGIDVLHLLNEDCDCCDKALFRRGSFPRNTLESKRNYPPFYIVYADGFGGQKSFGKKSIDGAIGAFVFVCLATGTIQCKPYSSKSQFCVLLKRFFIQVEAMDYFVRVLVLDGAGENISGDVEDVCDSFHVHIKYSSAAAPQELSMAEKGVQNISRITRALMRGAPHLPQRFWCCALLYACEIHFVLPNNGINGRSPYLMVNKRVPNMRNMYFKVFGAPTNFLPKTQSNVRTDALTVEGYFVGVARPGVLVARAEDWKVFRVSRRRLRVHEGIHIEHPSVRAHRKLLVEEEAVKAEEDTRDVPMVVPSIKSLRLPTDKQVDSVNDLGEGVADSDHFATPHLEENAEIVDQKAISRLTELEMASKLYNEKEKPDEKLKRVRELRALLETERKGEYAPTNNKGKKGPQGIHQGVEGVPEKQIRHDEASNISDINIIDGRVRSAGATHDRATDEVDAAGSGSDIEPERDVDQGEQSDGVARDDGDAQSTQSAKARPLKVRELPEGARVEIDTTRFDGDVPGSYSKGKPKTMSGTIVGKYGRKKGGVITVEYEDGDTFDSHWTHLRSLGIKQSFETMLMQAECMGMYSGLLAERGMLSAATSERLKQQLPPRNFFECLIRDDWRSWVESVRREMKGWDENKAQSVIDFEEADPAHPILDLAELFSIKRCGRYKLRLIALGNILRQGIDFKETFAPTVSADGLRWFLSMACAAGMKIKGGDISTAYLTGKQRTNLSAFIPSFGELHRMSWEELERMRADLLKMEEREGVQAIRRLSKRRGRPKKLWRLNRPVYGVPDAGNAFALKFMTDHTEKLGFTQSKVDPCIYWKYKYADRPHDVPNEWEQAAADEAERLDGTLGVDSPQKTKRVIGYIVLISWVDDVRYYGTDDLIAWYDLEAPKIMPIVIEDAPEEFVSLEVKQDLEAGTLEVTQSKYFLAAGKKFAEHLEPLLSKKLPETPFPENEKVVEGTDEERAAAAGLPYRELVGTLAYPSAYTRLDIRREVSELSRFLHAPTIVHWRLALRVLLYCIGTHDLGIMYSQNIDPHGVNVLYAYADSNFEAPKSTGCRMVFMNGAVVSASMQRHSTVDTSTTCAELTEAFRCGCDIMGFRNLHREFGIDDDTPTTLYQDCQPAIKVAEGKGSLAARTKFMDIRVFKIREWLLDREIKLQYCKTLSMIADLGTKSLSTKQFVFLRDVMNGYALVRASRAGKQPEVTCAAVIDFDALMAGANKRGIAEAPAPTAGPMRDEEQRATKRARHIRFE